MLDIKAYRKQKNIIGWLMCAPITVALIIFVLYPIIFSFVLSFTNVRGVLNSNVAFVGFDNYEWLFGRNGKLFWEGVWLSVKFSVVSTLIQTALGFILAYILYSIKVKSVQSIYRILLYLPAILPGTVAASMWKFIYVNDIGLLDTILKGLGMTNPPDWLSDPNWAFWSVLITNTWRFTGVSIVIYFMSMNAIPKEVLESARMDGANRLIILIHMIFPLTFSSTKVNLIMSLIGGIKSFDLFFLLIEDGVPGRDVVGLYIYETAFQDRRLAWAVTMSLMLTLILGVITFVVNKYLAGREEKL